MSAPSSGPWSRRRFLTVGAAGLGGAAVAATGLTLAQREQEASSTADPPLPSVAFRGAHQAGVATPQQQAAVFAAFDLPAAATAAATRDALGRMMRLWTDDIERLMEGRAPLGDTEPELAAQPAGLTVTVGLGARVFEALGRPDARPPGLVDLPAFGIDRLEERWSGGDVLVQIGSDDRMAVAHALRLLTKDARPFASARWAQHGFLPSGEGTPRNLMGQVDGTANPAGGEFDTAVWATSGPEWHVGGTTLVLRRIRMDLDGWDLMGRAEREQVIGRRLDNGAPLTGEAERDVPDLEALGPDGLPVIPSFAHIRVAAPGDGVPRMLRRGYSYDDGPGDSGLLFAAYQADIATQFLPVQQRLAERDLLNRWTTPVGSAVFAIAPGCPPGRWLCDTLVA
jgi:dye decolorizing peroxidase